MQYQDFSNRLVKALRLQTSPVATLFSNTQPKGVELLNGKLKACEMIELARLDGKTFCTTAENHDCKGSLHFLGFGASPEFVASWSSGDWQAGKFPEGGRSIWKNPVAHRRTIPDFYVLQAGSVKYISFAPLAEAPFESSLGGIVVNVICTPKQGLYLARMATWAKGGSVYGVTGPGTCSPILTQPLMTGQMVYTLGCFGIREFMRVKTEELLFGFPLEMLPEIVDNLENFLKLRWDMDAILDEPVGTCHVATTQERAWQRPPDLP